jgi:hypothetical protein
VFLATATAMFAYRAQHTCAKKVHHDKRPIPQSLLALLILLLLLQHCMQHQRPQQHQHVTYSCSSTWLLPHFMVFKVQRH